MRLTKRDLKIINFISEMPSTSYTIERIFFSCKQTCIDRLRVLYDNGYIKRIRNDVTDYFLYYTGNSTPKNLKHYDYISRSYIWIQNADYKILDFEIEKNIDNIRPDVIYHLQDTDEREGYVFVEVELSHNNIKKKVNKYEKFYLTGAYKNYFDTMPKILYFSCSKVKSDIIQVLSYKLSELS